MTIDELKFAISNAHPKRSKLWQAAVSLAVLCDEMDKGNLTMTLTYEGRKIRLGVHHLLEMYQRKEQ